MAITKRTEQDKIEIVGPHKMIQVRTATIIEEDGVKYKLFYGMSSQHAMEKHYGKMANYRSSEGRCIKVKYKGPLEKTILDYLGGIRSTCAYINALKIKHMSKCVTFVVVSQQLNTHLVK